jgi:ketosteroid isomerase-like protein
MFNACCLVEAVRQTQRYILSDITRNGEARKKTASNWTGILVAGNLWTGKARTAVWLRDDAGYSGTTREIIKMNHANAALIERFYQAFQRLDAEAMNACYAEDVVFSDPVFGELRGEEAGDMWRMLTQRAQDFSVSFDQIEATETSGSAEWIARYVFTQSGRPVVNHVESRFRFRDGLIVEQRDAFDLWGWTRQALGIKGTLLGWTPFVQGAIHKQARRGLDAWRRKAAHG